MEVQPSAIWLECFDVADERAVVDYRNWQNTFLVMAAIWFMLRFAYSNISTKEDEPENTWWTKPQIMGKRD